ncbi:hypothetical protein FHX59_001229 [Paraburkholderia silvatlantica]|uniref:Uncharacterized protein n=1 Tax=Paraburkholderia silvatlantica TaxID=321895 RepID=A0ABR6FJ55_9BURK|nr:hypothetical protein [Paraburkholderia silvatlantica]PVY37554.1 hypothetical protein C7411_101169 [Paraburkholderia silvatlantica]PXW42516.1 hypothetical protein C7413_101169 [Paraburkholderia silvatlantica]
MGWPESARSKPIAQSTPAIAATLIDANQYSNSPYDFAESRFTAVMSDRSTSPIIQAGAGIQRCRTCNTVRVAPNC